MARPKATTAPKSTAKKDDDRAVYTHNLWLNYLKPVSLGLVFSPNALRAAQIELPLHASDAQKALESFTIPFAASDDDEPIAVFRDHQAFLTGFLGWKLHLLDFYRPRSKARMFAGQAPTQDLPEAPEDLTYVMPQINYDDVLEPSFAYRWNTPPEGAASPYALIGLEVPHGVELDRKPAESAPDSWDESPQKKFERLLYETKIPLGIILHGKGVRLIYRPESQQSGYVSFPLEALLKPAGRLACTALQALLSHNRMQVLPSRQRLHHILGESRKYQNEVSTQLAEQVLAALFELLKGFEAADAEAHHQLLAGLRDRVDRTHLIYEGLLTVLMRLVFLLYAEEREMFPADDLFVRNYSIAGLFARLVEDESRHPDTMDQRFGAWAQLLVLFRLVYGGVKYNFPYDQKVEHPPLVSIPARRGDLFDPRRFPFLEGRPFGAPDEPAHVPHVSDGTILNVLRNLLYLKDERLSYRTLEVEQIGSVYEAVMGYRVETATGRSVAIKPEKRHGAPVTVDLDALLATSANKRGELFKKLTDRKLPTAAAASLKNARTEADLVAGLDRLIDRRLTPSPVPAGSLVFQPSLERRRTGSHYTPQTLTGPIVEKALEPILRRLGPNPTPEAILGLKVCDPAMGSGAFLVEAMRRLARLLVEAWGRHKQLPRIPADETPFLFACRKIAQGCLYGVDKNKMAVDLAKLSLWLATLAKDHSFTFLDHNLRHGDSLVGLSLSQVEACHWAPTDQQAFVSQSLRHRVAVAMRKRLEILKADDLVSYDRLNDLRVDADKPLDFLRFLGNAVLGVFFEGGTASAKERRRSDLSLTIRDYLNEKIDDPTRLVLRREIEQSAAVLAKLEPPLEPFHWEVEFPEVFLRLEADGSLKRRAEGGFDAMVGNPPFMGGRKIRGGFGIEYLNWLTTGYLESKGNADIVAFFYRRAFDLLREEGTFGLIATNTIGQGDTRSTGLRWICNHDGTIFSATKRLKWPGEAAVVVSVVHVHKGVMLGPIELQGRRLSRITAFLFHDGGHEDPSRLHANAAKSFQGSIVLGMGFTFDDSDKKGIASPITRARADELARSGERPISMEQLIESNPLNKDRIFPYIGGEEINDSPRHNHNRYAVKFKSMTLEQAKKWPQLVSLLETKVKPERSKKSKDVASWPFWLYWRPRAELYDTIGNLCQVLVCARHQPHWSVACLPPEFCFSDALIVFAFDKFSSLAILQSSPHELWARFFGSSMKDDLRYTPSDCFETFPFPAGWESNASLEAIGKEYYEYRAKLMTDSNLGLTKTYNRFHDPKAKSPEIRKLRELHTAMDRAVLAAYGWSDVDTTCGFDFDWCEDEPADDASPDTVERIETGRHFFETAEEARAFATELVGLGKKLPWRYRWRPEVRDDVLARLLLLNKERAEEERRQGLNPLASDDAIEEDADLDIDEDSDEDADDE